MSFSLQYTLVVDGLDQVTEVTGGHVSRLLFTGPQEVSTLEFRFLEIPLQNPNRLGMKVDQFSIVPSLSDDGEGSNRQVEIFDTDRETLLLTLYRER